MKIISLTLLTLASIAANNNVAEAAISPFVKCCEDNGGKYKIVDNGDEGQNGVCEKDDRYVNAAEFYDRYCKRTPDNDDRYTVYFANTCEGKVEVTIDGRSQTISPETCHVFRNGRQYGGSVTYETRGATHEAGGQASCRNIGSSNDDECDLLGMADNACVIPIELCKDGPDRTPTRKPTRKPERKPTRKPTRKPERKPTRKPTRKPERKPTRKPTRKPERKPTRKPTRKPERKPTRKPTRKPNKLPTRRPTSNDDDRYVLYFVNSCDEDVDVAVNRGGGNNPSQTIRADSCQVFKNGRDFDGPMITFTENDDNGTTQVVQCYENMDTSACGLLGMRSNACVIPLNSCP